jgi:hypothetical protein
LSRGIKIKKTQPEIKIKQEVFLEQINPQQKLLESIGNLRNPQTQQVKDASRIERIKATQLNNNNELPLQLEHSTQLEERLSSTGSSMIL